MLPKNHKLKRENYSVIRLNRQNNLGACYEATDNHHKRNVLLWEFFTEANRTADPAKIEYQRNFFANEASVLAGIRHAHILAVYDYFSEGDHHYLISESAIGKNFNELLKEKAEIFTLQNVVKWADQLLDALEYLHFQNPSLIHGGIKPENIYLTADGKLKLLPFGISVYPNLTKESLIRRETFDAANLHYSPLEQIWAGLDPASQKVILHSYDEKSENILELPANAQTDIYGFGATLFRLFTKQLPIDPLERSIDMLEGKADPLKAAHLLNPSIPVQISQALANALEIKRENRFQTVTPLRKFFKTEATVSSTPKTIATVVKSDEDDLLGLEEILTPAKKQEKILQFAPSAPLSEKSAKQINVETASKRETRENTIISAEKAQNARPILNKTDEVFAEEKEVSKNAEAPATVTVAEFPTTVTKSVEPRTEKSEKETPVQNQAQNAGEGKNTVVSPSKIATDDFIFSDLPKEKSGLQKLAIAAVALFALGGAGWGVMTFTKPKTVEANQNVSAENSQTAISTQPQPTETPQNFAPTATQQAEIAPQMTENPQTVENEPRKPLETYTGTTEIRTRSAAPAQRSAKSVQTPVKVATAPKKNLTVDDIINDN